ncbi:MAG: hypothetical protein LDL44_00060 [Caenispirillum sp.]|nr:hypothetical protein [Caenispirillum sp.]
MRTVLLAVAAVVALSLPAAAETPADHDVHHPGTGPSVQTMQADGPLQPAQTLDGKPMADQGGMMSGMMAEGGMMGRMMGQAAGDMGQGGMIGGMPGPLGPCAMMMGQPLDLTAAEARTLVDAMLIRHGNDRLRAGPVEQRGDKLLAAIETVDGSLVSRLAVDPRTGLMQPAE